MASPAPSEQGEQNKKITFRFCRECSNMLYPKEDKENDALMFSCRTCRYSEKATTPCIYRNELATTVGETAGITQDVGQDPTVGIPSGVHNDACDDDEPDFCTLCGQQIFCESCGQRTENGFYLEVEEEDALSNDLDSTRSRSRTPALDARRGMSRSPARPGVAGMRGGDSSFTSSPQRSFAQHSTLLNPHQDRSQGQLHSSEKPV